MRGKKARFAYRGMLGKSMPTAGWGNQIIGIDGEELTYQEFFTAETIPNNIEVLFNF